MSEPNKGEFMFLMKFRLFEVAYLISNLSMNISCLAKSASKGSEGLISRIYPEDGCVLHMLPNNKLSSTNNVSYFLEMRVNGSFEGIFNYLFNVAHIPVKKSTMRTRVLSISLHDLLTLRKRLPYPYILRETNERRGTGSDHSRGQHRGDGNKPER